MLESGPAVQGTSAFHSVWPLAPGYLPKVDLDTSFKQAQMKGFRA